MRAIAELIEDIPSLGGLSDEHRALVVGCGRNVVCKAGTHLFREGDAATTFYAIRRGSVAVEMSAPPRAPLIVETLHGGDVLGWSWLFLPTGRSSTPAPPARPTRSPSTAPACAASARPTTRWVMS